MIYSARKDSQDATEDINQVDLKKAWLHMNVGAIQVQFVVDTHNTHIYLYIL